MCTDKRYRTRINTIIQYIRINKKKLYILVGMTIGENSQNQKQKRPNNRFFVKSVSPANTKKSGAFGVLVSRQLFTRKVPGSIPVGVIMFKNDFYHSDYDVLI